MDQRLQGIGVRLGRCQNRDDIEGTMGMGANGLDVETASRSYLDSVTFMASINGRDIFKN